MTFTVMVTRPNPAGQLLCDAIVHQGKRAIHFPTLEFGPPADPASLLQQITSLTEMDYLIFVSPQSVYSFEPFLRRVWPSLPPSLQCAAVGGGTATALLERGLPVSFCPTEEWSSEGLLAMSVFHHVAQQKIAIVCGEGGRDVLRDELMARGARVDKWIAYQRRLPSIETTSYLAMIESKQIDVIVSTSTEGLKNLKTLLFPAWDLLQTVPLVVISDRMYAIAQHLGFNDIRVAENASHAAIVNTLSSSF